MEVEEEVKIGRGMYPYDLRHYLFLLCEVSLTQIEVNLDTVAPFTYLQPTFAALTKLERLYIHDCEVGALPDFMGSLPLIDIQLRKLDKLEYIAPEVFTGCATSLQCLLITDCPKMTYVPEEIGRCEQLQTVVIGNCHVNYLPESLFDAPRLRYLRLYQNNLSALPVYWSMMSLLQLDLSSNRLEELPEGVGSCLQLKTLKLSRNHLVALPETIGRLIELAELDIAGNCIARLPACIGLLVSLSRLLAAGNHMHDLPDAIAKLTALQELDLERNRLEVVPPSISALMNLTSLRLRGNPLFEHRTDHFGRDFLELRSKEIIAARGDDTEAAAGALTRH